ncbi:unnamed protein product, partial [Adineta steineri]
MLKHILISGAGIAGPTLAFWLVRYGMKVTVIERAPQLRVAGQTIDIRGAGLEVVRKMGLEDTIRAKTTQEKGINFVDRENRIQAAFSVDTMGGQSFVSEIEILRGELATLLYDQTHNDTEYIFGDKITAIVDRGDRVQASFANAADRDFDLVIIADGLNSKTRELVFESSTSPILRLGQYTSYFSIPYEESDGTWSRWYNAPGGRCVFLRPDGQGSTTTRAFLTISSSPNGLEKLDVKGQKAEMHKLFADAGWETPRVLSAMEKSTDFYLQEVAQVKMDMWSKDRLALLGDAGYCPSPISGMGTSVAIVGAYILAGEIARHENHKDAFASYETLLRPYITKAQSLPPGAPHFATPQTEWGIWTLHTVLSAASFGIRVGYGGFRYSIYLNTFLRLADTITNTKVEPNFVTVHVPMHDGIELAVDYFVLSSTNKYPAIVEITPYGRSLNRPNFRNEADYWLKYGYAFVIADARGTGDSGGEFIFLSHEGKDGYDLIEWIARQPWSTGRIGMRGASYSGENQWFTAREKPPHLSCITPSATPAEPMHGVPYENGAFALYWALTWIGSSLNINYSSVVDAHPDPKTWLNYRPLRTLDVYAMGRELSLYRTFIDHPTYDDFWRSISFTPDDFAQINIPTLAFTGWFDSTLTGTIEHYQRITQYSFRKTDHFLIVGPYSHVTAPDGGYDFRTDLPVPTIGDIPVPENGLLRARDMTREFYDWCLKDRARPVWDPIRLFVIGSNVWITPKVFPPEQTREVSLFLMSNGTAKSIRGNGRLQWTSDHIAGSDHYVYDPMNPIFIDMRNKSYEFPVDINQILDRNDILVYTTEKLDQPLTVVGDVVVELLFSSSAQDTDLVIQLMDVMPDGSSIKLGAGFFSQLRLRYRDGFEHETLMTPGMNYSVRINLNEVGHTFLPQHRVRLAITSSFYPWLSANPNTGGPIATDTQPSVIANQTIFYTRDQPSKIRLLVIDTPRNA